jgi:hypothetical protein
VCTSADVGHFLAPIHKGLYRTPPRPRSFRQETHSNQRRNYDDSQKNSYPRVGSLLNHMVNVCHAEVIPEADREYQHHHQREPYRPTQRDHDRVLSGFRVAVHRTEATSGPSLFQARRNVTLDRRRHGYPTTAQRTVLSRTSRT